jgi:hypothetical protein
VSRLQRIEGVATCDDAPSTIGPNQRRPEFRLPSSTNDLRDLPFSSVANPDNEVFQRGRGRGGSRTIVSSIRCGLGGA